MLYQQPQFGPLQVDWSNPLTKGMEFAYVHGGSAVGFAKSGASSIPYVSGTAITTPLGTACRSNSTSSRMYSTGATRITANSYSLLAFGTGTSSAIQNAIDDDDTVSNRKFQFRINSGAVNFLTFDTGGALNSNVTTAAIGAAKLSSGFVMGATASPTAISAYLDGVKTSAAPTNTLSSPTGDFYIGARKGGAQGWAVGGLSLVVGWSRTLSDTDMVSLAANPWQIFVDFDEEEEGLFPAAAAGGDTTVTCTVGDETEAGPTAAVSLSTVVSTAIYTETEAGPSASVTLSTIVAATVGAEAEAGPAATVSLSTIVAATVGDEQEAGLAATVASATNISLSVANENESGIITAVSVSTQVNCVIGIETEAGLAMTVTSGTTVLCAVGDEQEVGLGATITTGGGLAGATPWYQLALRRGKR